MARPLTSVSERVSVLTISARIQDSTVSVATDRLQPAAAWGSPARNLYASTLPAAELSFPPIEPAGTSLRPLKPAGLTATPGSTEIETKPVNFRAANGWTPKMGIV